VDASAAMATMSARSYQGKLWINVFETATWCAGSYQDALLHMDQCDHDKPEHRLLAASPVWLQLYRATAEDLD